MLGKMSVAQKGAAAFFILALIGAIAGGVSYTKTVGAMSEVQTASRISDVTSEALGLERVIFDQVLSLKTFLLTGDRDWLNRSQNLSETISGKFGNIRTVLEDISPAELPLLADMNTAWTSWYQNFAQKQIDFMRTPETVDMARALELTPESRSLIKNIEATSHDLAAELGTKKNEFLANQDSELQLVKTVSLASAILIAAFAVLMGFVNNALVSRPLGRLSRIVEGLAAGDTEQEIEFGKRSDEIGTMAGALGIFRMNLIKNRELEGDAARQREEAEDSQKVAGFSCNNHSISIATGIPYETVRRKVKAMVENGWLEFSDSSHVVLNSDKWQEVLSDVVDPERCVVGYVRSTDVTPSFSRNERRGSPADRRS